jgi:lipopolysaccharide transport system permease protein
MITKKDEVLFLRPTRGLAALNLRDLWLYRELIYFLTWRDILVRYKQTLLGATWAVLVPVLQMVVFTLLFGEGGKSAPDGIPYPIFSFAGLLPWNLFAKALGDAGRSLVMNRSMITKVYFPRVVIPIASVLGGVLDFAIAFLVLLVMMVYYSINQVGGYRLNLTPAIWTLPLFLLLALVTALGVSLWLSAMYVIYRDVGHILPFLTQLGLFATPIIYASSRVPAKWQIVYALNPMVGVVDGFRWALLGTQNGPGLMLIVSVGVAVVVLITGMFYFRHMERTFADEI